MTGADIKAARTAAKMTQKQLALALNIKPVYISGWETGMRRVPEKYREDLRLLLNMPIHAPRVPIAPPESLERVKGCPDTKCVYNGFAATGTHYCPFNPCPRV